MAPPEDVKDGVLEADGLQRALVPAAAAAVAAPSVALDTGDETRPVACPEGCPVEPLQESVASMGALLREWLEGSPSVQELEERFGSR